MKQIKQTHQRLGDADDLSAALTASWWVFDLIAATAFTCADESPDMYPAFTFARGAAVSGRNAIAFAPSLAAPEGAALSPSRPDGDVYETADALADLASALSTRLREAAKLAVDVADRSACEHAAIEAERITLLLAKGN